MSDEPPYTDAEAAAAWQWVNAHGPRNAWTATFGTAAGMIGRLLKERARLRLTDAEREAVERAHDLLLMRAEQASAAALRGLLERFK